MEFIERKKKFNIPIYFGEVWVIVTNNFEQSCIRWFEHNDGISYDMANAGCDNRKGYNNSYVVIFRESTGIDDIVHECTHLKNKIFKERGIIPDTYNDEAESYLMGYITKRVYKILTTFME